MKVRKYDQFHLRGQIIRWLCMLGILISKVADIMDPARAYSFKRMLRTLEGEALVNSKRKKIRGHSYHYYYLHDAKKEVKDILKELDGGYYERYLIETKYTKNRIENDESRAARIMKQVEVYVMMREAGVITDFMEKPHLNSTKAIDRDAVVYYTSQELKQYKSEVVWEEIGDGKHSTEKKSGHSRCIGLLISPGDNNPVYKIDDFRDLNISAELRFKYHISRILGDKMDFYDDIRSMIIVYENAATLAEYVTYRIKKKLRVRDDAVEYMLTGFDHAYVIPYTYDGRRLLEVMCYKDWKDTIKKLFLPKTVGNSQRYYYNDNKNILLFFIPDIISLAIFAKNAMLQKASAENEEVYEVWCCRCHEDLVRTIVKDTCRVRIMAPHKQEQFFSYFKTLKEVPK